MGCSSLRILEWWYFALWYRQLYKHRFRSFVRSTRSCCGLVFTRAVQQNPFKIFSTNVAQECPASVSVSRKQFLSRASKRVSSKNVPRECFARVSYKSSKTWEDLGLWVLSCFSWDLAGFSRISRIFSGDVQPPRRAPKSFRLMKTCGFPRAHGFLLCSLFGLGWGFEQKTKNKTSKKRKKTQNQNT